MKGWTQFLVCLLLSGGLWLLFNLSQQYTAIVNVPVLAHSSLEGRADVAAESVMLNARCSGTGFQLLYLRHRTEDISVDIDPADFEYRPVTDSYAVSAEHMSRYSDAIFGEDVTLHGFLNREYNFRFLTENSRKVPVTAVWNGSFKPQYMPSGPVTLQPDSVTIYGSPALLSSVKSINTRPLNFDDLSHSVTGVVRLAPPSGVRVSDREVTWALDVVRYVEHRSLATVYVRSAPAGVSLIVYPSTVDVTYRCVFPMRGNPDDVVEFYIDYNEFAGSLTGSCVVHADNLPPYVIDCTVTPEVIECMEVEERR